MKAIGQLVTGYLDFAERQTEREQVMTMEDQVKHLSGHTFEIEEIVADGNLQKYQKSSNND